MTRNSYARPGYARSRSGASSFLTAWTHHGCSSAATVMYKRAASGLPAFANTSSWRSTQPAAYGTAGLGAMYAANSAGLVNMT